MEKCSDNGEIGCETHHNSHYCIFDLHDILLNSFISTANYGAMNLIFDDAESKSTNIR